MLQIIMKGSARIKVYIVRKPNKGSSTVQLASSTISSRSWCPIITLYSGNCVTLDSWTEFILTSTKTEEKHLNINITTDSIPRLSLQHLQISPLVFTV